MSIGGLTGFRGCLRDAATPGHLLVLSMDAVPTRRPDPRLSGAALWDFRG